MGFFGSFVYLFHLLNNWPQALLYVYEESSSIQLPVISIAASRPVFDENFFANSLDAVRSVYGKVLLTACEDSPPQVAALFTWKATLYSHAVREWRTDTCATHFYAPHQGEYRISLRVDRRDNVSVTGTTTIVVRDIWIAAAGDSFASGEGNPDRMRRENVTAQWISNECHRSRKSWSYRVFEALRKRHPEASVHFSYLACTGSTVERGVLGPEGNSQFQVLREIANERGMGPDVLMLSVGGNDVGYGEILERLQSGDSSSVMAVLDWRFYYVASQLKAVKEAVKQLKVSQVLLPLYFDFTRNERGEIDATCDDMNNIRTSDVVLAERAILSRLNSLLLKVGREAGWMVEDRVPSLFRTGGICSKHRLIRSLSDSMAMQGDLLGAFHPTDSAHLQISTLLLSRLRPL